MQTSGPQKKEYWDGVGALEKLMWEKVNINEIKWKHIGVYCGKIED